jgi:hypothetical protein
VLEEKYSNEFKAFMWMIHLDPSPFDVDTTPRHMILQKYTMVLLHVSAAGRERKYQNSFLTSASVCNWGGLECNGEKEIVTIDLEDHNLNRTIVQRKYIHVSNYEYSPFYITLCRYLKSASSRDY